MRLTVQASCDWQKFTDRRQKVESFRQQKVARLRADVDKIAKREMEYAKEILDVIVPVKLVWDVAAWDRVKDFIPVKVIVKDDDVTEQVVVAPPVEPDA